MSWSVEASLGRLLVRPEYIDVTGDAITGLLLSQIVYWFRPDAQGKTKVRIFREGRPWVAKTQAEWCHETRIGLKQYLRAVKILQTLQIVEYRLWQFQGRPTPHLSLDLKRLMQLVADKHSAEMEESILPKQQNPFCQDGGIHSAKKVESYTESTSEITTDSNAAPPLGDGMPSLKQVLESKAQNQHNLEAAWKASMAQNYGGWQQPLTVKERGQLKQIKTWMIETGLDPVDCLKRMISRWEHCANQARVQAGLPNSPNRPHIGWVLQNRAMLATAAYDQGAQLIAPTPAPTPPPKAMAKPEPVTPEALPADLVADTMKFFFDKK
jgi:hypothetical protein